MPSTEWLYRWTGAPALYKWIVVTKLQSMRRPDLSMQPTKDEEEGRP